MTSAWVNVRDLWKFDTLHFASLGAIRKSKNFDVFELNSFKECAFLTILQKSWHSQTKTFILEHSILSRCAQNYSNHINFSENESIQDSDALKALTTRIFNSKMFPKYFFILWNNLWYRKFCIHGYILDGFAIFEGWTAKEFCFNKFILFIFNRIQTNGRDEINEYIIRCKMYTK